uniref:(northern house mosquito) hypothetical protein n=1 Tax=Culex pipiens TaxID=7175 RepID=A0A8D8EV82_CULPI
MVWRLPGRISRHNRPSSLGPGPFAMEATSTFLYLATGGQIGVGSCAADRGARLFFLKQFSPQFTPSHFALPVEEEQEGASDGIPSSDKIKLFAFLSLFFGH